MTTPENVMFPGSETPNSNNPDSRFSVSGHNDYEMVSRTLRLYGDSSAENKAEALTFNTNEDGSMSITGFDGAGQEVMDLHFSRFADANNQLVVDSHSGYYYGGTELGHKSVEEHDDKGEVVSVSHYFDLDQNPANGYDLSVNIQKDGSFVLYSESLDGTPWLKFDANGEFDTHSSMIDANRDGVLRGNESFNELGY